MYSIFFKTSDLIFSLTLLMYNVCDGTISMIQIESKIFEKIRRCHSCTVQRDKYFCIEDNQNSLDTGVDSRDQLRDRDRNSSRYVVALCSMLHTVM
jgi:hypothetical protein